MTLKKDKIGKVPFTVQSQPEGNVDYTDSSEEELLKIYSGRRPEKRVKEILSGNPSWPLLYHLSPARENLLNWYDFPHSANLLEVGAGCGALTGVFCKSLRAVTALELTEKRAQVIAHRYSNLENLEVVVGNVADYRPRQKYDFVTCVGVLEYAGLYIKGTEPGLSLLKILKNFLKPRGVLILAIENRLGLKYWAGCPEDHTGGGFDSIQGYPKKPGIKTFGRIELRNFLNKAGFNNQDWYFPIPDYKLPLEVYSEKFLPGQKKSLPFTRYSSRSYGVPRRYFFSESLAMDSIIKNNLFTDFSNSFLVFSTRQ